MPTFRPNPPPSTSFCACHVGLGAQPSPTVAVHVRLEAGRVAEARAEGGGQEALGDRLRAHIIGQDYHFHVSTALYVSMNIVGQGTALRTILIFFFTYLCVRSDLRAEIEVLVPRGEVFM